MFDLLNDYGRLATQTTNGNYFTSASIMFEAVTGRDNVSIAHQCRKHITRMREEIDDPNAFRVRGRSMAHTRGLQTPAPGRT
jgi:hypothetical protein